jgi:hypothetical protein
MIKNIFKPNVKYIFILLLILTVSILSAETENEKTNNNPPIYIAFLWHMHQPIYWPYEYPNQIDGAGRFPYSVVDVFNQRIGPYTNWPSNAIQKGIDAGLPHLGASISFSGSLIENLNEIESSGNGNFNNWKSSWINMRNNNTSLGNPRMDLIGFGYYHPLMGLIDDADIIRQISMHRDIITTTFPGAYSKGIFPPENAFNEKMIPALNASGIEWVLVDNIHFERAAENYPYNTGGNLYEPNKADVQNPDPGDWVQLNGLWAPTRVSGLCSKQPHYAEYIDPNTGSASRIIVVPTDRYMGNEDGRGGFGALDYENVMSQLEQFNTDPDHPMLIVLHHDGDNFGGGSEGYYGGNFQNFVNWLQANPTRFVGTTIQDYLDQYPPDPNDVIKVESGSWSGADNGDPEFLKWNGDPRSDGYSYDRNSWGIITAAKNVVYTADNINSNSADVQDAWKFLMVSQSSDYWYWDGSANGVWDSNPARGANQAVNKALPVAQSGADSVPPTIYLPQREPYNPGGNEWEIVQPSDFEIWTYVYDISGLQSVKLYYRTSVGDDHTISNDNYTYAGGPAVNSWNVIDMTGTDYPSETDPLPVVKATLYSGDINGIKSKLVDYYVEATDNNNNVGKSPIQHVWVGNGQGSGGGIGNSAISWVPENPTIADQITITITNASQGAKLHWGVNPVGSTWQTPDNSYWVNGSELFNNVGPAIESSFNGPTDNNLTITIGPFNSNEQTVTSLAFVIHYDDNTWDNNGGQDYSITLTQETNPPDAPTLNLPVDQAINQSTNLTVQWNEAQGATSYDLQIASDNLFQNIILNQTNISGTSHNTGSLGLSTVYYWRVKAKNTVGESNWSTVWQFTTSSSVASYNLNGIFKYGNESGFVIPNSEVTVKRNGSSFSQLTSDHNGVYSFTVEPGSYELNGNPNLSWSGVNATDALYVLQYLVGLRSLSPIQLEAADVNDNGVVNSTDGLLILRRVVDLIPNFVIDDWSVPSVAVDVINNNVDQNLYALASGDVNMSMNVGGSPKQTNLIVQYETRELKYEDQLNTLPVSIKNDIIISAATFVIDYPSDLIIIESVKSILDNAEINIKDGKIIIAWSSLSPETIDANTELLQIDFKRKINTSSNEISFLINNQSELADENANVLKNISLSSIKYIQGKIDDFRIFQNYPNPFNPSTKIKFLVPSKSEVQLVIYNSMGEVVEKLVDSIYEAGEYEVEWNAESMSSGVYFYSIISGSFKETRKMLFLK